MSILTLPCSNCSRSLSNVCDIYGMTCGHLFHGECTPATQNIELRRCPKCGSDATIIYKLCEAPKEILKMDGVKKTNFTNIRGLQTDKENEAGNAGLGYPGDKGRKLHEMCKRRINYLTKQNCQLEKDIGVKNKQIDHLQTELAKDVVQWKTENKKDVDITKEIEKALADITTLMVQWKDEFLERKVQCEKEIDIINTQIGEAQTELGREMERKTESKAYIISPNAIEVDNKRRIKNIKERLAHLTKQEDRLKHDLCRHACDTRAIEFYYRDDQNSLLQYLVTCANEFIERKFEFIAHNEERMVSLKEKQLELKTQRQQLIDDYSEQKCQLKEDASVRSKQISELQAELVKQIGQQKTEFKGNLNKPLHHDDQITKENTLKAKLTDLTEEKRQLREKSSKQKQKLKEDVDVRIKQLKERQFALAKEIEHWEYDNKAIMDIPKEIEEELADITELTTHWKDEFTKRKLQFEMNIEIKDKQISVLQTELAKEIKQKNRKVILGIPNAIQANFEERVTKIKTDLVDLAKQKDQLKDDFSRQAHSIRKVVINYRNGQKDLVKYLVTFAEMIEQSRTKYKANNERQIINPAENLYVSDVHNIQTCQLASEVDVRNEQIGKFQGAVAKNIKKRDTDNKAIADTPNPVHTDNEQPPKCLQTNLADVTRQRDQLKSELYIKDRKLEDAAKEIDKLKTLTQKNGRRECHLLIDYSKRTSDLKEGFMKDKKDWEKSLEMKDKEITELKIKNVKALFEKLNETTETRHVHEQELNDLKNSINDKSMQLTQLQTNHTNEMETIHAQLQARVEDSKKQQQEIKKLRDIVRNLQEKNTNRTNNTNDQQAQYSRPSNGSDTKEMNLLKEKLKTLEIKVQFLKGQIDKELLKSTQLEVDKLKLQSYIDCMKKIIPLSSEEPRVQLSTNPNEIFLFESVDMRLTWHEY